MKRCLVLSLFIISACATSAKYKKAMNSWEGDTVSHMLGQYGDPAGGRKEYEYTILLYKIDPDDSDCDTEFRTDGVHIMGWKSAGNCKISRDQMRKLMAASQSWNTRASTEKDDAEREERRKRIMHAIGAGFQSMGQSMSRQSQQTSCTSTQVGTSTYTNCN